MEEPPPCGEVCSYNGEERVGQLNIIPQIDKSINCPNIMGRMAWDKYESVYPPPNEPPPDLMEEFTQNGLMPLSKQHYMIGFKPRGNGRYRAYNKEEILTLQEDEANGGNISTYKIGRVLSDTLRDYSSFIQGKSGAVIGTMRPWLEAMLLNVGAGTITTLEYGNIKLLHPQLHVLHPVHFAKKFLAGEINQFDFAAGFSSLEHSGLGRYGDPINPYGDLEAAAQVWCMMKPGGLFILGLPCTKDMANPAGYIEWNAHRMYGPARLSQITANFDLIGFRRIRTHNHAVLLLRRL